MSEEFNEIENFKETKELKQAFSKVLSSPEKEKEDTKADSYVEAFKRDVHSLDNLPFSQEVYILVPSEVFNDKSSEAYLDASRLLKFAGNVSRSEAFTAKANIKPLQVGEGTFSEVIFTFPDYDSIEQVKAKLK